MSDGIEPAVDVPIDDAPVQPEVPAWDEPIIACPYCATPLDPPPVRPRLCPHCRQPIAVRHLDGRLVLLTEDAAPVFDEQRQREQDEITWTHARSRWLALAGHLGASEAKRDRLAAAPLTAETVDACRALYVDAADTAVRAARRAKRWKDVFAIRRAEAANLYADAGRVMPPPPDVLDLHRDAMLAQLRDLAATSRMAELASAGCCGTCRRDGDKAFRIDAELKAARLPHEGCPKGICGCEWWISTEDPKTRRRRRRSPAA